jgi:hypothetical protein
VTRSGQGKSGRYGSFSARWRYPFSPYSHSLKKNLHPRRNRSSIKLKCKNPSFRRRAGFRILTNGISRVRSAHVVFASHASRTPFHNSFPILNFQSHSLSITQSQSTSYFRAAQWRVDHPFTRSVAARFIPFGYYPHCPGIRLTSS